MVGITKRKIIAVILAIMSILFCSISFKLTASAEETTAYTDVLEDLQKDESFKKENFLVDDNKDSINLFQIAESSDKELFLYVFQPNHKVRTIQLTKIKMAITAVSQNFNVYELTVLSFKDGFFKCKVEDFIVSDDDRRIYDISTIYRKIEDYDNETDTVVEKGAKGKRFVAKTIDGNVYYSVNDIIVEEVVSQYAGFIRYYDNSLFGKSGYDYEDYDSFFLAFSTKNKIENLISAEVEAYVYSRTFVHNSVLGFNYPDKDKYSETLPVKKEFNVVRGIYDSYKTPGLLNVKEYSWNQIQTVEEFKAEKNLTLNKDINIDSNQWVLRFFNAPYITDGKNYLFFGTTTRTQYCVEGVVCTMLTFTSNDDIFMLGVVDNILKPSKNPSGTVSTMPNSDGLWDMIQKAISLVLIIVVCGVIFAILSPFIPMIVKGIALVFSWIVKGIWWVICLPFKLIGKLFKRKDS